MVILKLGQVVHIFVNNNPEAIGLAMRSHLVLGEGLRHVVGRVYAKQTVKMKRKEEATRVGRRKEKSITSFFNPHE